MGIENAPTEKPYKIFEGTLYDYTGGVYCGVLVPEKVAKKIAKLQCQYVEAVKRVLMDNKDDLHSSSWTLHYPEGEQKSVKYIDTKAYRTIEESIKSASTVSGRLNAEYPVFIGKLEEVEAMANAYHEMHKTENGDN